MRTLNKETVLTDGRLVTVEQEDQPNAPDALPEYTTAQLTDSSSQANKTKTLGKSVINSTTGRALWGGGNLINSPWVDGQGVTVHVVA